MITIFPSDFNSDIELPDLENMSDSELQEYYDHEVESLTMQAKCPICKAYSLIKWGRYKRKLITGEHEHLLKIQRVRCKECKTTHALIMWWMIPYIQLSAKTMIQILTENITSYHLSRFEDSYIYHIRRQYRVNWEHKLMTVNEDLKSPFIRISTKIFPIGNRQFMQNHCGYNFMISLPT